MSTGEFWFKVGSFVLVGMLWGCSNAVLKQTTGGADNQKQRKQAATAGGQAADDVWAGLKTLLGTKVRVSVCVCMDGVTQTATTKPHSSY